jgi:hypothetical protein
VIEARLPDGTALQFPDGTADSVIDGAVSGHVASQPATGQGEYGYAPAPPEAPSPPSEPVAPKTQAEVATQPGGDTELGSGVGATIGPETQAAAGRVVGAVEQSYRDTPAILTPKAQQAVEEGGPIGRYIVSPTAKIAGGALGAVNALGAGLSAGVGELTNALGVPALGRDLNMAAQVAPAAGMEALSLPRVPAAATPVVEAPVERPPGPAQTSEVYPVPTPTPITPPSVGPAFVPPGAGVPTLPRILDLIRKDDQTAANKPSMIPPNTSTSVTGDVTPITQPAPDTPPAPRVVPPVGELQYPPGTTPSETTAASNVNEPPASVTPPVGNDHGPWLAGLQNDLQEVLQQNGRTSLGAAATPEAEATMSPAMVKSNRRMAELNEVMSPPQRGEDLTTYVAGSEPSLAERSGDPLVSQRELVLRDRDPTPYTQRDDANSLARVNQFDDMSGSGPQLTSLQERQAAAAQADTQRIMQTAQPADLQPAADYYNQQISNPRNAENPDLVNTLSKLRDSLYDANGQMKTDPQSVWGMHDNITNLMDKAKDPLNASKAEKYSFTQLQGAKKVLDGVMNTATNGQFQTYLDNQANFFKQRNGMKVLQDFRPGLVNPKTGGIYADRFHRWVTDLAIRRGNPGVDPAMDLPDATMRGLIDIDNDLKRSSNIYLGKAHGSPTNLFGEVAKAAGLAGAHSLAAHVAGPVGNFVLHQTLPIVSNMRMNRLTRMHLAPPPGGFRPNPMIGPLGAP